MIQQISFLPRTLPPRWGLGLGLFFSAASIWLLAPSRSGQVEAQVMSTIVVDIVDEKSGELLPIRIELRDAKGRPQKVRGAVNRAPWSLLEGTLEFRGRVGSYQFDVFHGPQYSSGGGGFTLEKDGEGSDVVRLPRHCDVESEGWFAGDLLSFVPADETGKWLPAEDLRMATAVAQPLDPKAQSAPSPSITAATPEEPVEKGTTPRSQAPTSSAPETAPVPKRVPLKSGRWLEAGAYYDQRVGSGLLLHGWQPPAAVPSWVPPSQLLKMAKKDPGSHAELVGLWQAETPILLASGQIDLIQILSEPTTRDGKSSVSLKEMFNPEPRLFTGPRGSGRLVEYLYWQVLESGLRIAPSAGSGFGKSTSPLGYNRVYVAVPFNSTLSPAERAKRHSEDGKPYECEPQAYWQNLLAGRSFVTNGPLLRPTVNGELPGHVFQATSGEKLALTVGMELTVADPVEYVDVVFNGEAIYHARLDEHAKRGGRIPPLEVAESGWLVIRVVTQREETYRMATSAPYYFEFDERPRISHAAVEVFQRWLAESVELQAKLDPQRAKANEPYVAAARQFWSSRAQAATAP